jgi:hypothetical protein
MAEPFVFRFAPGEHGEPEVMYVADVRCACGLCGHVQMQRFYHSTPFHPLRVEGVTELALEVHEKADYECENCGEDVGPEHVVQAALTYGFPDAAGTIRAFVNDPGTDDATVEYELTANRRLDPQELPGWTPDSDRGAVYPRLNESIIEREFDRVFNPKLLWIELFEDWEEDPEGGAFACAAPGYWLVIDETEQAASELADEIEDQAFRKAYDDGDLMVIGLVDAAPRNLATHSYPEEIPGRWQTWLPEQVQERLEGGNVWAEAYVSRRRLIEVMEHAFEVARLSYELDQTEVDMFFSEITTPGEEVYGRGVSVSSVLRRAVYTGITPGEAGRLTAEEIAGMLLRVW